MNLKRTFIADLFDCVANKQAKKSTKELLLPTFSAEQLRKYGIEQTDINKLK